ncbi:HesA/MoeB/ThiF family protein [Cognatiyoonia sp. IB215182]|uniref:HesA/MoeB/ThiF family protein n=1 Tax=Cognatiyoonia sp. IB215182 TaxID=3097353 RepID=UPI002A112448|nr:ThiF family adenylyltransferase [Cognatiyoonia sp. IB215182]MDX8352996.1 ThiF family adenylyltransferase [Cognatiyoonia sp. IB215182]
MTFSYDAFTTRNIGFVSVDEQAKLRDAQVFVCGTGGMGGACVFALARMGVGRLILADIDEFETSNLNRQAFAFRDTIGRHKAEATRDLCLQINPEMEITVYHDDWPDQVQVAISESAIVVNGTDDLGASLLLYRTARAEKRAVIDAYASPLPSVYVTQPGDPMPEERLRYPTLGTPWDALSQEQRDQSFFQEATYVIVHSSSRHYIDLELAGEVTAGKRSRMSFAPMVISTGMLMAYEVANGILGRKPGADHRGWFFNPYAARVEHPRNVLTASLLRPVVTRFLRRMMA